jgi:hypothetical protein
MGSTSIYVKYPFPSIFSKKPRLFTCRRISKLLVEPDIQPFIHKLSTNNHKNNREIVPRTVQHNPSKNKKLTHTSRLPIQISCRFDSLSSASGGSIYMSQIHPSIESQQQLLVMQTIKKNEMSLASINAY